MLRPNLNKMAQSTADRLRRWHAYRECFSTPAGQVVLRDLMRFSGMLHQSAVPGDALETFFNEGKRRVGLRIVGFVNMSEDEALRIAQQAEEEHREQQSQIQS